MIKVSYNFSYSSFYGLAACGKILPRFCEPVPANVDERVAVEGVVSMVQGSNIYADKGFIGEDWQTSIQEVTGNRIWTVSRANVNNSSRSDIISIFSCSSSRNYGAKFHNPE